MRIRTTICLCISVMLVLWTADVASADTYYVNGTCGNDNWHGTSEACDDPPYGPKESIQAGINISTDGDAVIVAGGTYTGLLNKKLNFGLREITLKCADDDVCIIDCQGSYNMVEFTSSNGPQVILEGFTITGGAGGSQDGRGGAISCNASFPHSVSPTIRACIIAHNSADWGGGIYLTNGAEAVIENSIIRNNSASFGGGIYIKQDFGEYMHGTILGSTIADNAASAGGGIYLYGTTDPDRPIVIKRATIVRNTASNASGGGIDLRGGNANPRIVNCIVVGNVADADSFGGGLAVLGHQSQGPAQEPLLVNTLFAGNTAKYGGGIFLKAYTRPIIVDSHVVENFADPEGGGIF
ncbi:MAG: right-handed parallel beta-helix repeat-containing protein [Phycisphaerales bacterium]|nr:MAG: right-handed parallel beta-helix repeat-containing protein [Phycisphaerales bacterium]